jgi:hypothetical protein
VQWLQRLVVPSWLEDLAPMVRLAQVAERHGYDVFSVGESQMICNDGDGQRGDDVEHGLRRSRGARPRRAGLGGPAPPG